MNVSFAEKSAWGILIGLAVMSWWYFPRAFAVVEVSGNPIALGAISVVWVVGFVIFEAVYHAVIAASGGDEEDERDRLFNLKAERNAGFVLGIGLLLLVGHILATTIVPERGVMTPLAIAVWILFVMTVAEIGKLLWQIWYYRVSS